MEEPDVYTPPRWPVPLPAPPGVRLRLAQRPTPLAPWRPPGLDADTRVWVKRDDCTGITLSGNKVRKLEFLLADALRQGCDLVVTCGGLQSNHARATAVAARQLGLDCHLFLRTTDTRSDPGLAGNLLLDRLVGASISLVTPDEYAQRADLMSTFAETVQARGRRPYLIPEGGSNGLGSWGYVEAVRELEEQTQTSGWGFDDIVFACGSGGTAAGLALGVHCSGLPCRVHAVNVCDDAAYFYHRVNGIFTEMGADLRAEDALDIIDGYVGRGYALNTEAELALIRDVARATGVILDPVYSGKAFMGLARERLQNPGRFKGPRILFLHTGGLFGLYDKLDMLSRIL